MKKSFLEQHKLNIESFGFWDSLPKSTLLFFIEDSFRTEVIREFKVVDIVLNNKDEVMIKWVKRLLPLTDSDLEQIFNRKINTEKEDDNLSSDETCTIDFSERKGFLNRHAVPLPNETSKIKIIHKDYPKEEVLICEWIPFNKDNHTEKVMPDPDYLGTATVIEGEFQGIGFHAWNQHDSEFIWYAPVIENI